MRPTVLDGFMIDSPRGLCSEGESLGGPELAIPWASRHLCTKHHFCNAANTLLGDGDERHDPLISV